MAEDATPGGDARREDLLRRRRALLSRTQLFYDEPLHIVRGHGVWLTDAAGRQYLDCYNNVASVGHCHPRVVDALCRQARELNTHTRYLHEGVVEYAERLTATFPPGLDTCMLVCTGTEANELAMRIARTVTGHNGLVCLEHSYHGNSTLIAELSNETGAPRHRPPHIAVVEPPDTYRGRYASAPEAGARYADLLDDAIAELESRRQGTAAVLVDPVFDAPGALEAPRDYLERAFAKIRAAGGLCVTDEVQAGLARTGRMWGFEHFGVVPDIVTLGKPMGDGHPLAAVVTSREIADAFYEQVDYFNTFGGNPVSAAVGTAVLDVVEDEGLVEHVADVAAYLRSKLEEIAASHEVIGDVRGLGLFLGVELVHDRATKAPASDVAHRVREGLREKGVLVGTIGPHRNVLKVRPPLVFSRDDADVFVDRFGAVLRELDG